LLQAQESVFRQRLAEAGSQGEAPLRACWKRVPKALRIDAEILTAYLQQLLRLGLDAEAARELTGFLKRQWNDAVVTLVGDLSTGDPRQQLALLEKCLKQQPQNPLLLLTLARVSRRNQLWRRAHDCLEQALLLAEAPELRARLHTELARLLEQQGEQQQSLEHYRSAVRAVEQQW
jgi:HemY protein